MNMNTIMNCVHQCELDCKHMHTAYMNVTDFSMILLGVYASRHNCVLSCMIGNVNNKVTMSINAMMSLASIYK